MSETRSKKYLGNIQKVVLYTTAIGPYRVGRVMMPVAREPKMKDEFFFDGRNVHFHEDALAEEKCIIYESMERVERTTKGKNQVRLRP